MKSRDFHKLRAGIRVTRSESDSDSDTPTSHATAATTKPHRGAAPTPAKRSSRHAPTETTSKRMVSRFRQVVEPSGFKARDPRFDRLSGHFDEGLFAQSYGFIKEYEKSEVDMLRKEIAREKDKERKKDLERALATQLSRLKTEEKREQLKTIEREWKKKEAEAVEKGKKPFFLKKADVKKLALVEQYKSLGAGRVNKMMEKRRKKNSATEKRYMPYQRRSAGQ
ncbi:hypothetical protein DFJ73DRAFT_634158 [Zopfochytrium polystomum]|nr:hypothetical protein DFJ73DRAFT_634158 [Zopfochytrium polystomum]